MIGKLNKNILIYIGKCLTGCAVAFTLSRYFAYDESSWFLLSILLVLSPAGEEALPFTMDRIKANLIGSLCSMIVLLLGMNNQLAIVVAIVMAIIICASINLIGVARPALAAVAIILMHPAGTHIWDPAIARLMAVVGGCFTALIISYIFHQGRIHKRINEARSQQEA